MAEGYRIKVHRSLTSPILLAGVPRRFALLNGTFFAAFLFGLHTLWSIPVFIVLHIIAVFLTKKDVHFFQILMRHIRQKSYYRV